MWMQILDAAGFPVIGQRFPGDWDETLREANPHGFYESLLRHGIYYRTNPHPVTQEYVAPGEARQHAVKVFIPGLIRSDVSFLHRVIATVRPWREYEASITRMYALEDAVPRDDPRPPLPRMPPALEWWDENFALIHDIAIRRYACHVQSYDGVLAQPRAVLSRALEWIGEGGDLEAAVAAVQAATRRQHRRRPDPERPDSVAPHVAAVFDDVYDAIDGGRGLDTELIARMNALHAELGPRIQEHRDRIAEAMGLPVTRSESTDDGPFSVLDGEWA